MAVTVREQQPTEESKKKESEERHFMDSKENKIILFHSTEASLSQKFNKYFWRRAISKVLKITSSAHRVVWRANDSRLVQAVNKPLYSSGK